MADIKLRIILQDGQRVTATLDTQNSLLATMLENAEKISRTFTQGLPQVKQRIEQLLQQPLDEVKVTLAELAEAKEVLDAALLSAASQESRAEIIQLQKQVENLDRTLRRAATAGAGLEQGLGGAPTANANKLSSSLNTLNQSAFQVGQTIEDFLIAGARGAANNVNFLIAQYAALGGTLGIIVGTIASIGISIGTATGFFDDLFATLTGGADSIDEVKQKLQSLVDFDFSLGVTINEGNINQVHQNILQLIADRQQDLDEAERSLNVVKAQIIVTSDLLRTQPTDTLRKQLDALIAQRETLQGLLTIREEDLNNAKASLEVIKEQGKEIEQNARRQKDLVEAGAISNEQQQANDELAKDQEQKAKELKRLREQLEQQLQQARIQAIEDQEQRAIEAVRAEFQERIALATRLEDESAVLELERLLGQRVAQIRSDFREQELQKEQQFQDRLAQIRARQQVLEGADEAQIIRDRIQVLEGLLEAETENADRRRQLRLAIAEAEAQLTQVLAREAEEQEKISDRQTDAAQRFAAAFIDLRERLELAAGTSLIEILERRQAAIEDVLKSTELAIERRRELELQLLETQIQVLDEETRIQQQRANQIAQFLTQFVDIVEEAFRFEPAISEDDIRNQQLIFTQTERDLRDSLERREISQAQFSARMRKIDEERLEFFRQVEEERISVAQRAAEAITGILIEAAKKEIIARISKAIASVIESSAEKGVPLPALLAIAAAAFVSLRAIQGRLTSGFRKGGYTGAGSPDEVAGPAHRGEYYFTSTATSGQVAALDRLQRMMKKGLKLDDILRAYNDYSHLFSGPSPTLVPRRSIDVQVGGRRVDPAALVPALGRVIAIQEGHGAQLVKVNQQLAGIQSEMQGLRSAIATYSRDAFNDAFDKPRMYEQIEKMAGHVEKTLGSPHVKRALKGR